MASISCFQSSTARTCFRAHLHLSIRPLQYVPTLTPFLPRHRCSPVFSRSRKNTNSPITSPNFKTKKKKAKQNPSSDNHAKDDDLDEDAFEALFSQLEEDLKNDGFSLDDFDEEISEEDLAQLELELAEALGDDETLRSLDSVPDQDVSNEDEDTYGGGGADDDDDDDDGEEEEEEEDDDLSNLKTWQLRRLAYALKNGKRKTSIKNLAADVCLDRSLVLKLLRDPPPKLLLMSATLPDKPTPVISEPENKQAEAISSQTSSEDLPEPNPNVKMPVHMIQGNWSAQKRLKKVHLDTLERVYNRTKRPTNAMISSIVHVTNLPRKRVVKWFEERRDEDGVPDHRRPYQPEPAAAAAESVSN